MARCQGTPSRFKPAQAACETSPWTGHPLEVNHPLVPEILDTPDAVARRAAAVIAEDAKEAIAERGKFVFAVSGGPTSRRMLHELGKKDLPWPAIYIVQVDECAMPQGRPDRNLTHLRESLGGSAAADRIYEMPVENADLVQAAAAYAATLERIAGSPPILDLVQLELNVDGHTASLIPNDPVIYFIAPDVASTTVHPGKQLMTLTYPLINRARKVLWIVTGSEKAEMLNRLAEGDESILAGRIRREHAVILADKAAAVELAGLKQD